MPIMPGPLSIGARVGEIGVSMDTLDAERVRYYFTWVRDTRLADPDNVCHAVKYLLDGFRMAGLIPNDTWRYVSKLNNAFAHISEVEETLSMKLGEGVFVLMEWD
jgi:hypothetical protein